MPVTNRSGLNRDNVTVADALKAAGDATGIFGKWHLDGPEGSNPAEQGFDTVHQSYHTWKDAGLDQPENPKGAFSLAQGAAEFMTKHRDRPFFVYLARDAIHTALEAQPATLERFKAKPLGAQHNQALYAACRSDFDASIGLLRAKLRELGLEKNTLLAFTSDNGGTQQSSTRAKNGCSRPDEVSGAVIQTELAERNSLAQVPSSASH